MIEKQKEYDTEFTEEDLKILSLIKKR